MAEEGLAKKTAVFLERLFKQYYASSQVYVPRDYGLREYAANLWLQKTYIRHLSFLSIDEIRRFLAGKGPRHFYYSSARYMNPGEKDMDAKQWLSADLVFDIDADHLEECSGKIVKVKGFFGEEALVSRECIARAGFEAVKLFDALVNELGFDPKKARLEFSGHRGFHVVVEDNGEWGKSGGDVRRELVNYLKADSVLEETLRPRLPLIKPRRGAGATPIPPLPSSPGVRGRLARLAVRLAARDGIDLSRVTRSPQAYISATPDEKRLYEEYLETAEKEVGIRVDEQVTVDTKRLIRPWGSLHGKTGLRVEVVTPPERAEEYELREDTTPFHAIGPVRVRAYTDTPVLDVLGYRVKLRKGTVYRFPGGVAVYLMAKGLVYPIA